MDNYLEDPDFRNWVIVVLMIDVAKIELQKFTMRLMNRLLRGIKKTYPRRYVCKGCKNKTTQCAGKKCIVTTIEDEIRRTLRNGTLRRLKKIDLQKCVSDPWAIAKFYIPPSYTNVDTVEGTDFGALTHVIINCTESARKILPKHIPSCSKSIFHEARDIRNSTMHASPMVITDESLQNTQEVLVKMLNSLMDSPVDDAINKIKLLEADNVSETEAVFAFQECLKELAQHKRNLKNMIPKPTVEKEGNRTSSLDKRETRSNSPKRNVTHSARAALAENEMPPTTVSSQAHTEIATKGIAAIDGVETTGKRIITRKARNSRKRRSTCFEVKGAQSKNEPRRKTSRLD